MSQDPKNFSPEIQDIVPSSAAELNQGLDAFIGNEADTLMSDVLLKLRVNELVTTLRAQPLEAEATTMLNMLESLVLAGEITFHGFMLRVQNLFPDVFDRINPALRGKLMQMLQD